MCRARERHWRSVAAAAISGNSLDKRDEPCDRGRRVEACFHPDKSGHFCSSHLDEDSLMSDAVLSDAGRVAAPRTIGLRSITFLSTLNAITNIRVAFEMESSGGLL